MVLYVVSRWDLVDATERHKSHPIPRALTPPIRAIQGDGGKSMWSLSACRHRGIRLSPASGRSICPPNAGSTTMERHVRITFVPTKPWSI